jgi:hypothetical protein
VAFIFSKLFPIALAMIFAAWPGISAAQSLTIQMTPAGNATLTWNASAAGPVNVERSGNLTSWSVVSTGNANGTYTEAVGNATRAFYRLVPSFTPDELVFVQGNGTIPDLMVSNTETTWREWKRVRNWALGNGYALAGGNATGDNDRQPVQSVNWYDALKWCNARSEMEGRTPVYTVNGTVYRSGEFVPTPNLSASGYRLPTESEWAWAAKGGNSSRGYIYSGSNTVGAVAWYLDNAGGSPKPVATKAANELGLHDMSGNVFEWCWDAQLLSEGANRGGSWETGAEQCEVAKSYEDDPNVRATDLGFRVVRNAP